MNANELKGKRVGVGSGTVELGAKLGSGTEGSVYPIRGAGDPDEVVKVFDEEYRSTKEAKVRAMVKDANTPRDPTYEDRGIHSIVWPTEVVEHTQTDEFLGYTMPHKDPDQQTPIQRYARKELKWDTSDPEERYATALNLALAVHAIHRQGHAMGDMNHENILINDGFVSLIDCDSFHISGTDKTHPGDTYFPRYTPPEGRRNDLKSVCRSDLFGLGVHIFQLLMAGFHPYQATGSEATVGQFGEMIAENDFPYATPRPGELEPHAQAPDYDRLPADIRQLFEKCFGDTGRDQTWARPEAKDWTETLGDELEVDIDLSYPEVPDPPDPQDDDGREFTGWDDNRTADSRSDDSSETDDEDEDDDAREFGGWSDD